jgi:homeobox protein cut-like
LFLSQLIIDEGIVGRLAELDIVIADLERSNLRVAEVERRNGELRTEIAALQSGKGTSAEERANKLDMNFRTLELEYDTLAQKLEKEQVQHKMEKETLDKKMKTMEKDIVRRQEEADGLKTKLRSFDDYDEIKRELEILRHIEFSIAEDDEDQDDPMALREGTSTGSSLETLLVSRNKKLSNDLTILRVRSQLRPSDSRLRIQIWNNAYRSCSLVWIPPRRNLRLRNP